MATIPKHRKRLGENIRVYRKLAKLTQWKLAELADLNRNYIGEVERGEKAISVEALLRVARCVDAEGADLLQGVRLPQRARKKTDTR